MAEFLAQQLWHPAIQPQLRNSTPGPSILRHRACSPSVNPAIRSHSRSPSAEPHQQRMRTDPEPNPDEGTDANRHGVQVPDIGAGDAVEMGSPHGGPAKTALDNAEDGAFSAVATSATAESAMPPPPDKTTEATLDPAIVDVAEGSTRSARAAARRPIINPINKIHGPPSAPTKRSEALRDTQAVQKAMADTVVTTSNVSGNRDLEGVVRLFALTHLTLLSRNRERERPDSPKQLQNSHWYSEKVTKSNAAKNLCYKAYLDNHEPLTSAAFEAFYKALPKEEIKRWNELSKSKKVENHVDDG